MRWTQRLLHPGPDGAGDPPAPLAAPPEEPAAPDLDRHAQGILRELTETRAELKRLREERAAREEADRKAAEQEALKRGEHESLLKARDAELEAARQRLADYEAREEQERQAAAAQLEAALSQRTDADSVRQACERWGGADPRRQLAFLREHVAVADTHRPGPPPPKPGGRGDDEIAVPAEYIDFADRTLLRGEQREAYFRQVRKALREKEAV